MTPATMNKPVALADVLAYRHSGVVQRYAKEHNASTAEAEEVFGEMLKWLYLCYRSTTDMPEGFAVTMTPELEKIDWMWHTFVLFTREYAAFCDKYFGFFLHHVPEVDEVTTPPDEEAVRAQVEKQFALVYDVLGQDTLIRWHDECRYAVRV